MRTAWKAIPTLSRTCAHCCSGLSAAHGSADQWRILVGPDAHKIDELVRRSPGRAYDVDFFEQFAREVGWPCLPDIAPTLLSPTGGEAGEGALGRATVRETVDAISALEEDGVSLGEFAAKLALVKSATPAGYGRQLTEVYLVNLETGTGRPARIVLGDPMPEMVRLLPEPG